MYIFTWCVLPSLICLFVFLQFRHIEGTTLEVFLADIQYQDVVWQLTLIIIIWPAFLVVMLILLIIFNPYTKKMRARIKKPKWLNAKFLIKEINTVQNGK